MAEKLYRIFKRRFFSLHIFSFAALKHDSPFTALILLESEIS